MLPDQSLPSGAEYLSGAFLLMLEEQHFEEEVEFLVGVALSVSLDQASDPRLVGVPIDGLFVSLENRGDSLV